MSNALYEILNTQLLLNFNNLVIHQNSVYFIYTNGLIFSSTYEYARKITVKKKFITAVN